MGNIIEAFASGFGKVVGKLFSSPVDFLSGKSCRIKRKRRLVKRGISQKFYTTSEEDYNDESFSYHSPRPTQVSRSFSRRRDYKGSHLRNSLRPRKNRARVRISGDLSYKYKRNHIGEDLNYGSNAFKHGNYSSTIHGLKVTRTSKFANKGMKTGKRVTSKA